MIIFIQRKKNVFTYLCDVFQDSADKSSSPKRKLSELSDRRRNFASCRSQPISETAEANSNISDENHNRLLAERLSLGESEEKSSRKNSFKEVTKHLVPGLLYRSSSFGTDRKNKLKVTRAHTQPTSPLARASSKRENQSHSSTSSKNLDMGRVIPSEVISGANGSRTEDSHPASVESFVRKCADCFGE